MSVSGRLTGSAFCGNSGKITFSRKLKSMFFNSTSGRVCNALNWCERSQIFSFLTEIWSFTLLYTWIGLLSNSWSDKIYRVYGYAGKTRGHWVCLKEFSIPSSDTVLISVSNYYFYDGKSYYSTHRAKEQSRFYLLDLSKAIVAQFFRDFFALGLRLRRGIELTISLYFDCCLGLDSSVAWWTELVAKMYTLKISRYFFNGLLAKTCFIWKWNTLFNGRKSKIRITNQKNWGFKVNNGMLRKYHGVNKNAEFLGIFPVISLRSCYRVIKI